MSTKDILYRLLVLSLVIALMFYASDYFDNKDVQKIKKHQKIGRIFNVNITNGGTGSRLEINYSLINNNKLIHARDYISVEEYNNFSNFIKDSTLIVYDSTGKTDGFGYHRIIYKPDQFNVFNLDRSDTFYQQNFEW